jgi:hypothetical protein
MHNTTLRNTGMHKPALATALLLALACHGSLAQLPDNPRDFSGLWMNDNTLDETLKRLGKQRLLPGETLEGISYPVSPEQLTPAYQAIYAERRAAAAQLDEGAQVCDWVGMPNIMTYPYPFEILQSEERLTMIFEVDSQVRRIFLDRDEHLPYEELDPTYFGDSIAHWEGNTLVIDTVAFHDFTNLWGNLPHSEQLHISERIYYVDEDTIHNDMVLTDPLALKEPMTRTVVYSRRPDWRIKEYSCLENNRDRPDAGGRRAGGLSN